MRRAYSLAALALVCFAMNSILCRVALRGEGELDPVSFAALRLGSGALALRGLQGWFERRSGSVAPSVRVAAPRALPAAAALTAYALLFSLAYVELEAAAGALLLFIPLQLTMMLGGLFAGEKLTGRLVVATTLAVAGLVVLTLPGVTARPPWLASSMMVSAGIAFGLYSLAGRALRGTTGAEPLGTNARMFSLGALLILPGIAIQFALGNLRVATPKGVLLACLSGAVASGLGYTIWYRTLRLLEASKAAVLQSTVPLLVAGFGVVVLRERLTLPTVASALLVVLGVSISVGERGGGVR